MYPHERKSPSDLFPSLRDESARTFATPGEALRAYDEQAFAGIVDVTAQPISTREEIHLSVVGEPQHEKSDLPGSFHSAKTVKDGLPKEPSKRKSRGYILTKIAQVVSRDIDASRKVASIGAYARTYDVVPEAFAALAKIGGDSAVQKIVKLADRDPALALATLDSMGYWMSLGEVGRQFKDHADDAVQRLITANTDVARMTIISFMYQDAKYIPAAVAATKEMVDSILKRGVFWHVASDAHYYGRHPCDPAHAINFLKAFEEMEEYIGQIAHHESVRSLAIEALRDMDTPAAWAELKRLARKIEDLLLPF